MMGFKSVGSPIMAKPASVTFSLISCFAPDIDDSSSAVAIMMSGRASDPCKKGIAASIAIAKKLFISQLPSPCHLSSCSVMEKGSDCQRCSSNGTVSECPLSTRPFLPLPNRAIRFDFPALPLIGMISTWKPSGSSQLASR